MTTQTNWISVESRFPDHGQTVLIVFGPNRIFSLATHYCGLERKWLDAIRGTESYSPDFWMPLPEAPPKPDPFEKWWGKNVRGCIGQPGFSTSAIKEWCRLAWEGALKSKEHAL